MARSKRGPYTTFPNSVRQTTRPNSTQRILAEMFLSYYCKFSLSIFLQLNDTRNYWHILAHYRIDLQIWHFLTRKRCLSAGVGHRYWTRYHRQTKQNLYFATQQGCWWAIKKMGTDAARPYSVSWLFFRAEKNKYICVPSHAVLGQHVRSRKYTGWALFS